MGIECLEFSILKNPDNIASRLSCGLEKDGFTVAKEIEQRQKCPHYFPYRRKINTKCGPRF